MSDALATVRGPLRWLVIAALLSCDPKQVELLTNDRAAQHLLTIINDFLDLSKIEAERFELHPTDFDLAEVAANVASIMQERVAAKGLQLQVDCVRLDHWLKGDVTRLTQALLNLVSNAVKFTESGEVSVRIRCPEIDGARIKLHMEVQDTGIRHYP